MKTSKPRTVIVRTPVSAAFENTTVSVPPCPWKSKRASTSAAGTVAVPTCIVSLPPPASTSTTARSPAVSV